MILGLAMPFEFQICDTEKRMTVFVRAREIEPKKTWSVTYFPDLNQVIIR